MVVPTIIFGLNSISVISHCDVSNMNGSKSFQLYQSFDM